MNIRAWMKNRIQELPTGEYVCNVTTLDNISAFDVLEPVVRCRDCAYYDDEPELEDSFPKCWSDKDHRGRPVWTQPNGFCAWGERKVVDE